MKAHRAEKNSIPEDKLSLDPVGGKDPVEAVRELLFNLPEGSIPISHIESIDEVYLEQTLA